MTQWLLTPQPPGISTAIEKECTNSLQRGSSASLIVAHWHSRLGKVNNHRCSILRVIVAYGYRNFEALKEDGIQQNEQNNTRHKLIHVCAWSTLPPGFHIHTALTVEDYFLGCRTGESKVGGLRCYYAWLHSLSPTTSPLEPVLAKRPLPYEHRTSVTTFFPHTFSRFPRVLILSTSLNHTCSVSQDKWFLPKTG